MRGLPEKGQQVFVVAPSGHGTSARVYDSQDGASTLFFDDDSDDPIGMFAGSTVAIQYTNPRGICRIDGQAQSVDTDLLRVDHTGKIELIQRREFVRIDAMVPVTYEPLELGGWKGRTTTTNVSGGGFMVSGRENLRVDDELAFTLELDGDVREAGPLSGRGRVVRETRGGLGIEITEIARIDRERLIRWVFARERLARRVVRGF
jgi:hypothetical protein